MSTGNWNVICDRCGMKRKASDMRMTWDNLFVCADHCWEPRQPQDFVEGRADDQTVEIARPDVVASTGETTLSAAAAKNATSVSLTSTSGVGDRETIGIVLDAGECHWTFSDGVPAAGVVTLGSYLPGAAASGNTVYVPGLNNETYLTATGLTATGL